MPSAVARLGIVIVTHNNSADLPMCLDALHATGQATESYVIVRDCNSTDKTVDIAKEHLVVSKVIVGDNIGFGAGCNDAVHSIERAVDMLLILNPDTAIGFDVADLLQYVEKFGEFGCIGVRQQSFDGRLVWSWDKFPSPWLEWQKARKQELFQRSPAGYSEDRRVDWTMGAFLLIPRDAFDHVGGFDERFFMFCEEIDLCKRLGQAGLPTYFVNEFAYAHDRSDKGSLWREVLRLNSRRMYDNKWLSRSETITCQLAHSYRWLQDLVRPTRPRDRRLALPRLLATWNLVQAAIPPTPQPSNLDSWAAVTLPRGPALWRGARGDFDHL